MKKNGEISTEVIVGFIILITSVMIIFVFWNRLEISKVADETLCYNSVVERSAMTDLLKNKVPLNCKTGYYCISKDGTCEIMSSSTNIIKVETSDDVYNAIAEKMASCWSEFGEGKYDYIGKETSKNFYCSNCYQIGFDDSLSAFFNDEIDKRELYRFMSKTNVSETDTTYLDYLIGVNAETIEQGLNSASSDFGSIKIGKQYIIVMGIYSNIDEWKTTAIGTVEGVGLFALLALTFGTGGAAAPILILAGAASGVAGGASGYLVGAINHGDSGQQFLTPTLIEANSEDYSKLNCASITTLS